MSKSSTHTKLIDLIATSLSIEDSEVVPSAHFVDDLGADSLDTIELIMDVEAAFNIQIDDEQAEKLTTVGKLVDYVEHAIK